MKINPKYYIIRLHLPKLLHLTPRQKIKLTQYLLPIIPSPRSKPFVLNDNREANISTIGRTRFPFILTVVTKVRELESEFQDPSGADQKQGLENDQQHAAIVAIPLVEVLFSRK